MGLRDRIASLHGKEGLELFVHARNYLSADLLVGVVAFVSLPVLTRLLSREEYGTLELFLSVVMLFALLLELNFRGAVNRYWLEKTDDFNDFLATNLAFLAVTTALNLGWIWLAREPLARFFELPPDLFYLAVVCAAFRSPWNLTWKLLVAQKRSARFGVLKVVRETLRYGVGVAWVFLLARDRYLGMVYTVLLLSVGFGVLLSFFLARHAVGGRLRLRHLRYALLFGVPLIPHALSGGILTLFDRIIVAQVQGTASAGLYSLAYNIGNVMGLAVVAVNQSWIPIFTEHRNEGRLDVIERLAATSAGYVYGLALVLVLLSQEIVFVLAGPAFHEAQLVVPVVVFGQVFLFLYMLYSSYAFYLRCTWLISLASLLAAAANVGLNYWAIPIWGYAAAAWTTLACYALLFLLHFFVSKVYLREQVVRLGAVLPWLLFTGVVAMAYSVAQRFVESYLVLLLAVKLPLVVGAVWLIWRRGSRRARPERA